MSTKKLEKMNDEQLEAIVDRGNAADKIRNIRRREDYDALCRMIAEFVFPVTITDTAAPPVLDFRRRMAEHKYDEAAKLVKYQVDGAPDGAVKRARERDVESDKKAVKRAAAAAARRAKRAAAAGDRANGQGKDQTVDGDVSKRAAVGGRA